MSNWVWIAAGAAGFGFVLARWSKPRPHARQVARAIRVLARLTRFDGEHRVACVIAYLRKVDPYVFEELLLTAFARRGIAVRRNARYSGDGGIDGRLRLGGERVYLQAKRYRTHIRAGDVRAFQTLVAEQQVKGIFAHTGRTGRGARAGAGELEFLSGRRLADFVLGEPVRLFGRFI